jgi:hypothetical protein
METMKGGPYYVKKGSTRRGALGGSLYAYTSSITLHMLRRATRRYTSTEQDDDG